LSGALAQVRDLSVTYWPESGRPVPALHRSSLQVESGQVLGILGESGSGKSTLALALLRLLPASARCESGAILFRNRDLLTLSESELRRIRGAEIALIPQDPALALNPVLSIGTQLSEVIRAHAPATTRERRRQVHERLQEVGFDRPEHISAAHPHQLSGGERQRVVIAQAMACRPALIIADEPTSKLDASLQTEILSLMAKLGRQHHTAFLLISHDPAVLAGFANRIVVMYAGRTVEEGSVAEIFRKPLHPYTQALVRLAAELMGDGGGRRQLAAIEGGPPDLTSVATGCPFASRCPERMQLCTQRDPEETEPEPSRRVRCFKYEH
jgi:peptide/nickel transport system ATP-binding protein